MKKAGIGLLSAVVLAVVVVGVSKLFSPQKTIVEHIKLKIEKDIILLDTAIGNLKAKVLARKTEPELQTAFREARLAWKKIEWLVEYYFPELSKNINGAAILEYEDESGTTVEPRGFQVVETYLFPFDSASYDPLLVEVDFLKSAMKRLKLLHSNNQLTESHIFDALRLETFRVLTLGITGFDSPQAQQSLPEAKTALRSIWDNLTFFESEFRLKSPELYHRLESHLAYAQTELKGSFDEFDRLHFIVNYLNPLSQLLLQAQRDLDIKVFDEARPLRVDAENLFEAGAFWAEYYAPSPNLNSTQERAALGKALFYDPVLSGNGKRSCASCHQPDKGFADGLTKALAFDAKKRINRNTPTILNAAVSRVLFADSRVNYLEDQIQDVVTNPDEMHGSFEASVEKIKSIKTYLNQFEKAYPDGVTSANIKNAIASYERSLVYFNSRFDRYVRGEVGLLDESEKNGFNIFAGKGKCATCHFLPLTNGTVPPVFDKSESEVLGTFTAPRSKIIDPDLGKFNLTGAEIHRFSFKTPTVRNIALTAPYMHNGAYKTLEEVVDFYDHGGAVGLGVDLPNQTLPPNPLNLTQKEKNDLVAFMRALTDAQAQNYLP